MRPSRFRVRQRVVPVLGADQSSQRGQATIGGMASSNRRRAQLLHSADTRSTRFSCRVVRQRRMLSFHAGWCASGACCLRKKAGGEKKDSATTAEGPPHVRGDAGAAGVSRRLPAERSEGTPEGLARPRSAGGSGGARGRLRRGTVRPSAGRLAQGGGTGAWRYLARSRRGDPRLDRRSREGALSKMTARGAAVGEGPLGGRAGGGRGE